MRSYTLAQLLERSAHEHGDGVAVVDRDRSITYDELDRRSNQVARLLVELGVAKGDRVGLYLDKSLESVAGVYGAMKAGAAYVPFDPQAPPGRLAMIAGDCAVRAIITGTEKAANWPAVLAEVGASTPLIVMNGKADAGDGATAVHDVAAVDAEDDRPVAVAPLTFDLAYILYTSGSTGRPKGVMLSHHNALAFVDWAAAEFSVSRNDRLSSHAPLHFDLSVFDLYAAAHGAARVVLVPQRTSVFPTEIRRFINDAGITVWYSVPSILTMLLLRGGLEQNDLPSLRTLLFAGEVFPTKYLRELVRRLAHVRFANLYGPTETNVCTWYEVPPLADDDDQTIPIGRPIADTETFVVGDNGTIVATGEVGELLVRGSTVMQGYWGDRERTERTLLEHPFSENLRDRAYRTGDLVQEMDDGNYRYLGRRDAQIKSRGYRIELGDIESAANAHPEVVECAAVAVPDDVVTNRIKLFVVVRDDTGERDLVAFCAQRIPKYMVPDSFEFRDELPKTSTGKIDRQSLQKAAIGEEQA